ncbi:hypothetical protein RND71_042563 [Anisodus tanguticus]|uniref:Protein kinase domain-containing protein n=1 Tax=Anisodus tanguticus TaxID=243964 RepID=A0AAE1QR16_9SOLA|nr:hypothetical protein RND71_042563 [Anisodus tanguticus]
MQRQRFKLERTICSNGKFIGLQLESMGLSGNLDIDTLSQLTSLRTISIMNNNFEGPFPDVKEIGGLRGAYLSKQKLHETLLLGIPKLVELQLQDNKFDGTIPAFAQQDFQLNVANNRLEGPIPSQLSSQSASSFAGNLDLCGKPMPACPPSKKKKGISTKPQIIIITQRNNLMRSTQDLLRAPADLPIGKPVVVRRFRQMSNMGKEDFHEHVRRLGKLSHPNVIPLVAFYYMREEKLLVTDFVENGSLASHLHDLYVVYHSGYLKLVKRLIRVEISDSSRAIDPGRVDPIWYWLANSFEDHKRSSKGIGIPLQGAANINTPTWPSQILKCNLNHCHNYEPLVADYALVPVINKDHAKQFMVAYKSPEYMQNERLTRKTDVWSLGILILELLTGRFPANYLKQGKGANADLAVWVNLVVREEWTGEVFDKDMNTNKYNYEGEMLKLLKIGMCCCEMDVGRRWDLREALEKIEELKESDDYHEEDYSSNYASEG